MMGIVYWSMNVQMARTLIHPHMLVKIVTQAVICAKTTRINAYCVLGL